MGVALAAPKVFPHCKLMAVSRLGCVFLQPNLRIFISSDKMSHGLDARAIRRDKIAPHRLLGMKRVVRINLNDVLICCWYILWALALRLALTLDFCTSSQLAVCHYQHQRTAHLAYLDYLDLVETNDPNE